MTRTWLAGTAMVALLSVGGAAQTTPSGQVPSGEASLGSVTLPRAVMANGQTLAAGTYQVYLTAESVQPAVGIQMERWVEFRRGGKAVGKEMVSIVPAAEAKDLQPGPDADRRPPAGSPRVEMLKGDEFLRVWINRGGVSYLIHLPPAKA
jgi:hypothetical protein